MISNVSIYQMSWGKVGLGALCLATAPFNTRHHWQVLTDSHVSFFPKLAHFFLMVLGLIPIIGLITAFILTLSDLRATFSEKKGGNSAPLDHVKGQPDWLKITPFEEEILWDTFFEPSTNGRQSSSIITDTERNVVIRLNGKILLDRYSSEREKCVDMITDMKIDQSLQQWITNATGNTLSQKFEGHSETHLVTPLPFSLPRFIEIQQEQSTIHSVVQWGHFTLRAKEIQEPHAEFFSDNFIMYTIIDYDKKKVIMGWGNGDQVKSYCPFLQKTTLQEEIASYLNETSDLSYLNETSDLKKVE